MLDAKTRARLIDMAATLDVDEIALRTGHEVAEIQAVLDGAGLPQRSKWWVRCNRSGGSWTARSKSDAYYIACLHGLVDWDWGKGGSAALLLAAPAQAQTRTQTAGART